MTDFHPDDDPDEPPDGEGRDSPAFEARADVGVGGGLRGLLERLLDGARSSPTYQDHLFDASPGARQRSDERVSDTGGTVDSDAFRVDVQRTDDAVVVTADMPGVDVDELSVGVRSESNDLVIRVRGEPVERVPLPWEPVVATRKRFHNGILEVEFRPVTDASER